MERWKVIFNGKVQGVFFRAESSEKARKLKLSGFVKNLIDGTVEAEIQGDEDALHEWIKWCNSEEGPGEVKEIQTEKIPAIEGERGFNIAYDE